MTEIDRQQRMRAALADGMAGRVPPNIALMRLLMEAASPAEVDAVLAEVALPEGVDMRARLQRIGAFWRTHPEAWALVHAVLAAADHDGPAPKTSGDAVAHWAGTFDRLAESAPEAGVALYALGDPDLLAHATAEIVDRLDAWGLLGPSRDAIEIGCGTGRFVAALAPCLKSIVGLDISAGMIDQARRRCAGLANVRLEQTDGRDLKAFATASADLILAVDVYPYLVLGGANLVERQVAEAVRVLRPGGDMVILNFSYRGDAALDQAEVFRLASDAGLRVCRAAAGDFALWDGTTFLLRR